MDFGIWQAYGNFLNKNMMAVIIIELTFCTMWADSLSKMAQKFSNLKNHR